MKTTRKTIAPISSLSISGETCGNRPSNRSPLLPCRGAKTNDLRVA